jgi:hypothetical protein
LKSAMNRVSKGKRAASNAFSPLCVASGVDDGCRLEEP